nr:DNA-binding protein [uncultured Bacteroides sp.]
MAILFRKHARLSNLADKNSAKKVYPTITYKYSNSAKLKEVAQEISTMSGVSEGNSYSVLKDFRTYLKKTLLAGRIVNIDGLGHFYLSAQSKGTDTAAGFTSGDITGLRICFRANSDIRIVAAGSTRSDGLVFKDVDRINETDVDSDNGGGSGSGEDQNENPLG